MTVLVVEDEPRLAASLVKGFSEEGFAAVSVGTAGQALARAAAGGLRAIVLDLGLPDRDGQDLIADLRRDSDVPILVLTARDALEQRVTALDSGADDYLVKPFAFAELLARLRATLRRAEPAPRRVLQAGGVELATGEPVVKVSGRDVVFSPRERALIELLISRIGEVTSRRDILREAFGYDFDPGTNIVEVHIGHVRRKLAGAQLQIETVRGFGYRARVGELMARDSIRRRFLVGSVASTLLALLLFAVVSFVILMIDDPEADMKEGDSFASEVAELFLAAMAVSLPIALVAGAVTAHLSSKRTAAPLEDAIRAARETTAQDLRRSLPVPERDDELRDLVVALNELFARLDDGFGALARFAADASHELRTPLAVIATELEVALRHPRKADEWEATGRAALIEARKMAAIVEGLLVLARADADSPAARTQVKLVDCIDSVIAQLSASAESAGVSLVAPADDSVDHVTGNPVMLETAIRNLVENAIAAVPRGGRVRVSVDTIDREITVAVDDDGPGLGANPEALFTPFRRGAASDRADTGGRGAGVGLGLAIARRVAIAHGGRLDPMTSASGGARFALTLPRV